MRGVRERQGIYASGDVAGPPMLAHRGEREGMIVAEVIAGDKFHPLRYGNIPHAPYCHPEVASIGLTEAQVKEKKIDYKIGKFPFSANDRARTSGETERFVKIIRDAKYGEILGAHIVGAHIVGAHATELIHKLAVARENEYTVEEIELAIHAHPTLGEAIGEATPDAMGHVIHVQDGCSRHRAGCAGGVPARSAADRHRLLEDLLRRDRCAQGRSRFSHEKVVTVASHAP